MANPEMPIQTAELPSQQTEQLNNDATKMILMHAPAISLLRYQLVCKNWAAMIQEPQFKKDHFKRNDTTNEPLRLLKEVEEVSSGVFCEKPMVFDVNLQHREIWMPRDLGSDGQFIGSCNGLLCIEVKGEITVFNPITREVVHVLEPTYIKGYEVEVVHTDFLFHSATGEYKVMLFYWNPTTTSCVVNLYTLGSNSPWRQVREISCFPYNGGVNVEDTIYWPYMSDYDAITSFDLSIEKIKEQFSDMKDDMLLGLTKWDSKVCTVGFEWEHQSQSQTIKLWTLDNSAEHPWPSILRYENQLKGINGDVWLLAPYSIQMNRLSYATSEAIFFHDLSRNPDDVIKVTWPSSGEIKNCFAYVESLVPVPN